jgi:LPXTG-site transpeptidase (sortase) family protein
MFQKFLIYFAIFFVVIFALLNSRFVSAEFRFWLDHPKEVKASDIIVPVSSPIDGFSAPVKKYVTDASAGYTISIPTIGITAPVVLEKSLDPNVILGRLSDGVVHYSDSPLPGEEGTSVILGHSSAYPWYKGKYGSIFALLGNLKNGDAVVIANGGKTLVYKVSDILIFNPLSNNSRLQQISQSDNRSSVLLVSCWPVGTNLKRIAVRADLVANQ